MLRTTCHLDFMSVVADGRGILLVVHISKKHQACNVKCLILYMFVGITEGQKQLLQQTFRPMDQIDTDLVQVWVDFEGLRPIPPLPKAYTLAEVRTRTHEQQVGRNWPRYGKEYDCTALALPQTTDVEVVSPNILQAHLAAQRPGRGYANHSAGGHMA